MVFIPKIELNNLRLIEVNIYSGANHLLSENVMRYFSSVNILSLSIQVTLQ